MKALVFLSDLEELVIHNARPSTLGAKVLQSLIVQPVHASNLGAASTLGEFGAPLCPFLRRFGLKYDRWLRPSEQFDLIPTFVSIIRSREHSNYALQSFRVWITSDQYDPFELIEGSRMSRTGLERLANESGIKGERLLRFMSVPSLPHSQDEGPRGGEQVEVREFPGDSDPDALTTLEGPRGGDQVEANVLSRDSNPGALTTLRPSTWFPTLVESTRRFLRRITIWY